MGIGSEDTSLRYVFFGTGEIALGSLVQLVASGLIPVAIVTAPDRPKGRELIPTPSPVKRWAQDSGIDTLQPERLDETLFEKLRALKAELFVLVDYGTFLPRTLLDISPHGTLNMHPSLLPRLRGPSPIRSAILTDEKKTGISIMLVSAKMDEGPIVAQRVVSIANWPPRGRELDATLSEAGGMLLAHIIPLYVRGELETREQNHDLATYSSIIKKEDGLLDLAHGDAYQNLLKIKAFDIWPGTYAFFERSGKKLRVQILDAHLDGNKLIVDMVKPEGKKEMLYTDFLRSGVVPL